MPKPRLSDRLRYRFDNTLSRGPIALIAWLGLATLLLIVFAIGVDLLLGGIAPQQGLGPRQVAWSFLFQALVPNPPGNFESPWQFLVVMLGLTLSSLLLVSLLIGILATSMQQRIERLRRGRSRVIEKGHTVILGWSPQVFTLVSELAFANRHRRALSSREDGGRDVRSSSTQGHSACVVILAEKDKVEMEDEIRTWVPKTLGTRVVCRNGSPLDPDDLQLVSPDTARAIIVVSPGGQYPDLPVGKTLMALAKGRDRRANPYHIVAPLHKAGNLAMTRMIAGDEAQVFLVDNLISRLIAQTCRQSGLSVVYGELLSFEGAAIHFHEAGGLAGNAYGEALCRLRNATLIGLQYGDGRVQLNPPMETQIASGDRVIAIAADGAALQASEPGDTGVNSAAIRDGHSAVLPLERLLMLGWNRRGPLILEQLGYYLPADSQVLVLAPFESEQMQAEAPAGQSQHMQVTFKKGDPLDRPTLESVVEEGYQFVIILSPAGAADVQIADASTMLSLLLLRDIAGKMGRALSIVSEIMDVRNRYLTNVSSADDTIIGERLVALAMAQIAENKDIAPVFIEFLSAGGPEIYLKPAGEYIAPNLPINFYTVVEAARRKGQTAIGYRLHAEASAPERAFGVHLNPDKPAQFELGTDDRVIVLAEE